MEQKHYTLIHTYTNTQTHADTHRLYTRLTTSGPTHNTHISEIKTETHRVAERADCFWSEISIGVTNKMARAANILTYLIIHEGHDQLFMHINEYFSTTHIFDKIIQNNNYIAY